MTIYIKRRIHDGIGSILLVGLLGGFIWGVAERIAGPVTEATIATYVVVYSGFAMIAFGLLTTKYTDLGEWSDETPARKIE